MLRVAFGARALRVHCAVRVLIRNVVGRGGQVRLCKALVYGRGSLGHAGQGEVYM